MLRMTSKQHAYILFIGSLALTFGLIPTIINTGAHVPLATSLPVATVLGIYGLSFFAVGQRIPAIGMVGQAAAWALIALGRQ